MASIWGTWHMGLLLASLAVGVVIASGVLDRVTPVRWDPMGTAAGAVIAVMVVSGVAPWWWLPGIALAALPIRPRGMRHPLGRAFGLVVAIVLVGLWATVPDTEAPLVTAAVLIPVLAGPRRWGVRSTGRDGVVVGIVAVAAIWVGWAHRWPAAWGAAAILGVLGLSTALAWWPDQPRGWPWDLGRWSISAVLAVQVVTVVLAARVLAFASGSTAFVLAVVLVLVGYAVTLSAVPLPESRQG